MSMEALQRRPAFSISASNDIETVSSSIRASLRDHDRFKSDTGRSIVHKAVRILKNREQRASESQVAIDRFAKFIPYLAHAIDCESSRGAKLRQSNRCRTYCHRRLRGARRNSGRRRAYPKVVSLVRCSHIATAARRINLSGRKNKLRTDLSALIKFESEDYPSLLLGGRMATTTTAVDPPLPFEREGHCQQLRHIRESKLSTSTMGLRLSSAAGNGDSCVDSVAPSPATATKPMRHSEQGIAAADSPAISRRGPFTRVRRPTSRNATLFVKLILLLCFATFQSAIGVVYEEQAKSVFINGLLLQLSPLDGELSTPQQATVRDVCERVLEEVMLTQTWEGEDTVRASSGIPTQLDYLLLTDVETQTYDEDAKTVTLLLDGVAFFTESSSLDDLPEADLMTALAQEILDGNADVLTRLENRLGVSNLRLTVETKDPIPQPTSAPSFVPTSGPTPAPVTPISPPVYVAEAVREPDSTGGGDNTMPFAIGAAVGGIALIIGGALFIRKKNRKGGGGKNSGPKEIIGPEISLTDATRSPSLPDRSVDATLDDSHESIPAHLRPPIPAPSGESTNTKSTNGSDGGKLSRFFSRHRSPSIPKMQSVASGSSSQSNSNSQSAADFLSTSDDSSFLHYGQAFRGRNDFDEESSTMVSVAPQLVPVRTMESFEHQYQHHGELLSIKKDMIMGCTDDAVRSPWQQRQQYQQHLHDMGGGYNDTFRCALAPTDVSAATLAVASQHARNDDDENDAAGADFAGAHNPAAIWSKGKDPKRASQTRSPSAHSDSASDYQPSESDTFGAPDSDGWDPDDASMSSCSHGGSDAMVGNVIVSPQGQNQSLLLQKSVRQQSEKLQQLRSSKVAPEEAPSPPVNHSPFSMISSFFGGSSLLVDTGDNGQGPTPDSVVL